MPSAAVHARKLLPLVTARQSKIDIYPVHDELVITLKSKNIIQINTGWETGWTNLTTGDTLAAGDWMVDNYGPEGLSIKFNDQIFAINYHGKKQKLVKKIQSGAIEFTDHLCKVLKTKSFIELTEACWLLSEADDAALWRMRNLARVTLNPADFRHFSDRS